MIRRSLTAIAVALGVSLIPAAPACAEAPPVKTQVPGYYRMALGELEVTALYDGYIDLDTKILSNASPAEVQRLLVFLDNPQADCAEINLLIDAQLAKVRARLASMQALERQLIALRGQCATPHTSSDCGILHELVAAAHGEACACHPAPR